MHSNFITAFFLKNSTVKLLDNVPVITSIQAQTCPVLKVGELKSLSQLAMEVAIRADEYVT